MKKEELFHRLTGRIRFHSGGQSAAKHIGRCLYAAEGTYPTVREARGSVTV